MADEPDPLVEFLIEGAAERALPNLQERLADAEARFEGDPRQAAASALWAIADFLALTCQPGVNGLPALPGARIFEALASALRDLDEGRVSGLLAPSRVGHNPPIAQRERARRFWAAVAVECRRLRRGGALTEAAKEIGLELGGTTAQTLRRWHKDFQAGGNAPIRDKCAFEREFLDARRAPSHLAVLGTDEQRRAAYAQALAALESEALSHAADWTRHLGPPPRPKKRAK